MDTKLIELREQLSNYSNRNGKFNINLKKHITLNDGDELNIRNVFIDSKKESNTILVEEDTILTMVIARGWNFNNDYIIERGAGGSPATEKHINLFGTNGYLIKDGLAQDGDKKVRQNVEVNTVSRGDTITYYPCFLNDAVGGDFKLLNQIEYQAFSTIPANYGGFDQTFQYTSASGETRHFTINITQHSTSDGKIYPLDIPSDLSIIYKESDGIKPSSPNLEELKESQYNTVYTSFSGSAVENFKILELLEQTINITVPAGNYQPSILAQTINLQINNLNGLEKNKTPFAGFITDTVGTSLFTEEKNSIYGTAQAGIDETDTKFYTTDNNFVYFHMVSEDNSQSVLRMGHKSTGAGGVDFSRCMCGASVFEIVFDPDTQTFKIPNMHTPYYVSVSSGGTTSSEIGINVKKLGDYTSINTKRGDIKILSLTSNQGGNFWYDKLGFDSSILTKVSQAKSGYNSTLTLYSPSFSFDEPADFGVRKTDAYINQSIQLANDKFNPNYSVYTDATPLDIPLSDTIQIFGKKTLNDVIVDDAYFKVIINGISTTNKLYNEESINMISALVGKYYSGQSYTNGFSTDGISYTHRGSPITLSSFDISILNSKDQKPNIGDDNTIIIQVNNMIQKS